MYGDARKDITGIKPDIIGISMMTHSRVAAWRLIRYIKDQHPDIKIVVGGMHVSVMYKQIAEEHKVVCVIGEGEITLGELMERWENNEPIDKVNGIAYYDEEQQKVVVTPGRALIEDLDVLPFPKHDLFLWEGKRMAGLLTSRGCPYKCNFCVLDAASRRKVRCRSAKNIVDEVEMILESHPSIDTVWIHDDAFMIMPDRTIEFCKEVVKRGIKTSFVCSARFRPISREVVMLMAEAGFKHVFDLAASCLGDVSSHRGVGDQGRDRGGYCAGITRGHDQAGLLVDHRASGVKGGDNGTACGHGFKGCQAAAF